jgi:hypothetical protein
VWLAQRASVSIHRGITAGNAFNARLMPEDTAAISLSAELDWILLHISHPIKILYYQVSNTDYE